MRWQRRRVDVGAVMLAERIRHELGCRSLRVCVDQVAEYYGVTWVVAELPSRVHAVCDPEQRVVLVSSRLGPRARRFYLCHEVIECLNPVTIVHGSHYNEVSAHLLVPPRLLMGEVARGASVDEMVELFDVPKTVLMIQIQMMLQMYGKASR